MSLTLYVNYERTSNSPFVTATALQANPAATVRYESSIFYRKKQVDPYNIATFVGEEVEMQDPQAIGSAYLSAGYVAEYRFNGQGDYIPMRGLSSVLAAFDVAPSEGSTTPIMCSIFVSVSAANQNAIFPDLFTFDSGCYKLSALSSTALAFEDVSTKDVYAFYWPVSGKVSSDVTSLLASVQALTGGRVLLNELDVRYTTPVYVSIPNGLFQELIQTTEYRDFSSANDVLQPVYKILRKNSSFETVSGSNYLAVTQLIPELPLFASRSVGKIYNTNGIPYLSGDILQYEMSAVFFDEFPSVDFIAFPKTALIQGSLPLRANVADYSNYDQVCGETGLSVYGEGHVETIYLSAKATNASDSASIKWFVGNTIITPTTQSTFVINGSDKNNFVAYTCINTVPGQVSTYPIAAIVIDPKKFITEQSPILTYSDKNSRGEGGGVVSCYPFVYKTTTLEGENNPNNTVFRNSVSINTYPSPNPLNIKDPFASSQIKLPYDNSTQRFIANIFKTPALTGILEEDFVETRWNLQAKTSSGNSWSIQANTAPSVENYVFNLGYDEDRNTDFLPLFKTSNYDKTTVTLNVSCIKNIKLEVSRIPTDVYAFQYSLRELSSSALAFQDIKNGTVFAYYWGASGVDSSVRSLTSYLENNYGTVSAKDLGGAITAQQMITGVYDALANHSETTITVLSSPTRLFLTQPNIGNTTNYLLTSLGIQIFHSFEDIPTDQKDWQPARHAQVFTFQIEVSPKPLSVKPFTPSFYNLKHTEIPFVIYFEEHEPYRLSAIDLECPLSEGVVRFYPSIKDNVKSKNDLKQTLEQGVIFNKIGLADLKITAHIVNVSLTSVTTFPYVTEFADAIEIVDEYDAIDDGYLYSFFSPPQRTYTKAPLLSPNEWLVSENINDSLKKLHSSFQDLNELTLIYDKKDTLHSWIQVGRAPSELKAVDKYIWDDLMCVERKSPEEQPSWFNYERQNPDFTTQQIKWEDHLCDKASDPGCSGKHCINWNWKKRKATSSSIKVTWKKSRRGGEFQKKWQFEKCETEPNEMLCDKLRWNVSSFDKKAFPIPYSVAETPCKYVDGDYIEGESLMVVAHPQMIKVYKDSLESEHLAQTGTASELFSFQEIVGIETDSEGKIFVLDKVLPKVIILQYSQGDLVLHDSWGGFGYKGNAAGFNQPQDIHIDQDNFVWIADTGNNCVKKYTANGRPVMTINNDVFTDNPPISLCVDVNYNIHVLLSNTIVVFNKTGTLLFEYVTEPEMTELKKININYNREMVYVCFSTGVAKYFKTGAISHYLVQNYTCGDGEILQGFDAAFQNESRDAYVISANKILKFGDLMKIVELKGHISDSTYWALDEILIDREEFVQPWVYLRAFHRLWDNIEIIRSALFYQETGCRSYNGPVHNKSSLLIGQNELVTNTVLNRLIKQLWDNIESLYKYFDPECEKKRK